MPRSSLIREIKSIHSTPALILTGFQQQWQTKAYAATNSTSSTEVAWCPRQLQLLAAFARDDRRQCIRSRSTKQRRICLFARNSSDINSYPTAIANEGTRQQRRAVFGTSD